MVTYKNFLVTYTEFLGYLSGISWLPISLKSLYFTGVLILCNQVSNQVSNQAINQEENRELFGYLSEISL